MERNVEFCIYVVASDLAPSTNPALLPSFLGIVFIPLIQDWNDQLFEVVQECI